MACPYCYARAMYDRFKWNAEPRLEEDVLNNVRRKLYLADKPLGIFMCSTFEWLWNEIWAWHIFRFCAKFSQHRFYLLTKQPQNLIKFSPFPPNCYVGVTIDTRDRGYQATIHLKGVSARIKFASFEPLLEKMDGWILGNLIPILDQVIIGAQTKPYKPPKIEWVEEIVRAADRAGVKVFLKDNLVSLLSASPDPMKAKLFYSEMGLRQEMPGGK